MKILSFMRMQSSENGEEPYPTNSNEGNKVGDVTEFCGHTNGTEKENIIGSKTARSKLPPGIDTSNLLSILEGILEEFTEKNRAEFAHVLKNISTSLLNNNLGPSDGYHLVSKLIQAGNTPYFHFYADSLYIFYLKLFAKTVKQSNQTKILVYEHLLGSYNPTELFSDIISLYNGIDNFSMGGTTFKNYALYKILGKEHLENNEHKETCKFLLSISHNMDVCPGFVDYLSRSTVNLPSRSLLIAYVYWWLEKVPVDLNKVQNISEIKDVECKAMSKIFAIFPNLRSSFKAYHATSNRSKTEYADAPFNSISDGKELQFEMFIFKFLFKHEDLRCIFSSIYKRLTFFFLLQNKRIFGSVKMLRVFSKADIQKIYKLVRNTKSALVNVFTQLDKRYILRELLHSLDVQVFKEINPRFLSSADLLFYYKAYLMILEREKIEDLTIKVTDLDAFSRAFNALADKSFVPFLRISHEEDLRKITPEISQMLVYYSAHFKNTFLDVVFLSSVFLEDGNSLFNSQKIPFYINILTVVTNISETITLPLRRRFMPIIKKLLCYDVYVLHAGMLAAAFGLAPNMASEAMDIKIIAALNHPSFETLIDNEGLPELERETAILYYIHHKASYAESVKNVLLSILQHSDHNTLILLDYLERLSPETSFPFSFISENIHVFYFLLDSYKQVLPIFINNLRHRSILPCMVVPHIICGAECDYVLRMHQETALNSIPDALYIVTRRIKTALNNCSIELEGGTAVCSGGATSEVPEPICEMASSPQNSCEKALTQQKLISKDDLKSIVDYELRIPFIESISKAVGPRKVAKKMPPMPGVLMAFVILRQLRSLDKKSKEIFFGVLEENAQDEQVMELIGAVREFYKHMNKGIIPVEYMLKLVDGH